MSRITFFMLVGIMQVSANVFSQNKIVDIRMENVSLVQVLNEVSQKTGYDFLYNYDVINSKGNVNVDVRAVKVSDFLDDLLKKHGLEFEMRDQVIVVRASTLGIPQVVQKKVSGTVKDRRGNTLPGVTVLIKGTTLGAATDADGKFVVNVVNVDKPVLIFSFIGMKNKEVEVVADKPLSVVLEEDVAEMEEVVVTGYFNKSKESFTGSEVTVKGEELKRVGSLNVIQALSAFDPSIRLAENLEYGSDPNRVPDITVRGENGFDLRTSANDAETNPNAPLYVLDGVEVSAKRVYDLDMNRIDQMTILKDATATSLYGSRGANGVIVITTVRPKAGQVRITANANFNVSIPDLRDYNRMNALEKLEFEKLSGKWTDKQGIWKEQMRLDRLFNEKLEEAKRGVDTYWLSQPLQRSLNQRYSLNFEGGDSRFRYGIDLRYDGDRGVMKGSAREKYGINVIFNYNIGENFYIRNDVMIDNVTGNNSPYGSFNVYARENPYDRIHDENGDLILKLSSGSYNPLVNATLPNFSRDGYTSIQDNFNVDWRIIESLRLTGRASYTKQLNDDEAYKSPKSAEYSDEIDGKKKGSYDMGHSKNYRFDGNVTLAYFKNIGNGVLSVGIGSNMTTSKSIGDFYRTTGFVSDKMDFIGAAIQFRERTKPAGTYDQSRLVGFFANLNYGYDNRYFVDLSYRTDGSSKFGRNSRFAPFWSTGLAWNVHKEHFWNKDTKNALKVRASVGSTGSVNFSSSQALTTYFYDFENEYNGIFGVDFQGYGNPDLKWQNTMAYNVGVDWTFLNGRVQFNGDAYIKITDNLLLPIDVVPSTGFVSYVENLGQVKNSGVEGRLRVMVIDDRTRDLNWSVTLSAFRNRNVVKKLSNQLDKLNANANNNSYGNTKVLRTYEAGRSQSALMVVRSGGIDPQTGNEVYLKLDGSRTFEYDFRDKVIAGDMYPDVEGNINSNLNWKGFNLYMLFKYKWGGKIFNNTLATQVEGANPNYNADRRIFQDRWKNPGDEAMFRRITDQTPPRQTTRLVFDDNLFSLQSLSLSCDMPLKYAKMIHADRIKVMISTTDIFRLSTIKQERGTMYPFARTFTAGLNVTFGGGGN